MNRPASFRFVSAVIPSEDRNFQVEFQVFVLVFGTVLAVPPVEDLDLKRDLMGWLQKPVGHHHFPSPMKLLEENGYSDHFFLDEKLAVRIDAGREEKNK